MLTLAAVSTLARFVAAASLGIAHYFEWGRPSTGGALALAGGIYMWVKCRSWDFWKKWIWLWVGITVVLAFLVMNFTSQSLPSGVNDPVDDRAPVVVSQACDDLYFQLQDLADQVEGARARLGDWEASGGWVGSESRRTSLREMLTESENEFDQLYSEYKRSC